MSTFPIYKQSIRSDMIVKFEGTTRGVVMETGSSSNSVGDKSDTWYPYTDKTIWKDCSAEWLKDNIKSFKESVESLTLFQTISMNASSSTLTKVPGGYVITSHSGHQLFIKEDTKETL